MASLATCIEKAGKLLTAEDRAAIMLAAQEFRRQGMKPREAELAALERRRGTVDADVTAAEGRMNARVEIPPEVEAPKLAANSAEARIAEAQQQQPGLQVMVDGMDKPMPLAEFMAAVKAEADELAADAPLMELAAACALSGP